MAKANKKRPQKKQAKKQAPAKKAAPKKALKKKASAKKAASAKKPVTKKTAAKKSAVKKQTAVKKAVSAKRPPVKKPAVKKKSNTAKVTPVKTKPAEATIGKPRRTSTRALTIGAAVRITKGQQAGANGKIVRQDDYLGTYFVTLDAYKNVPAYKNLEWGPYFPPEMELVKQR